MGNSYFIVCHFDSVNSKANGIEKKIQYQFEVLKNNSNSSWHFINLPGHYKLHSNLLKFYFGNALKEYYSCFSDVENVYIRRPHIMSMSVLKVLRYIRKNFPNSKIVYEIPTYPYDKEIANKAKLIIDKIFRSKLKNVVSYITVWSNQKKIFGCDVIQYQNGVNCSEIPCAQENTNSNSITLTAVAQFAFWHGYDRILVGLGKYYSIKKTSDPEILLNLVGYGNLIEEYKIIVSNYKIEKYVNFVGPLYGNELDDIFNKSDIGVSTLGFHRTGVTGSSSVLKSKEYLARGLPLVTSAHIDVLPKDSSYELLVPEDDSPIDIYKIIDFYNLNVKRINRKEIREFAEKNCDMLFGMKNIYSFFK